MPKQSEERQNVEDFYQNFDIHKQKEPVAPYKYSDIPPPQLFHNSPLQP